MPQTAQVLRLRSRSCVVIPARMQSTRLPRKMLLRETGKPLLQHTYERAEQAQLPLSVIVATDHEEIAGVVSRFGGQAQMTRVDVQSGTDRVAEVAAGLPDMDIIVNLQGDEPELPNDAIDSVIRKLEENPSAVMSTLATPIRSREQLEDPACVKVVFDDVGKALYFSRSPIPYARDWDDGLLTANPPVFHLHIGLYAYRRSFLLQMAQLPPAPLENVEKLEQLRVLAAGHQILVAVTDHSEPGIDTPSDYRAFVTRMTNC